MIIQVFQQREAREAVAFALQGNVAIHLHRIIPDRKRAPGCFVKAVDRGEDIAHVFGQDAGYLRALARCVGVKIVYVHHEGTEEQHVDLCGRPLRKLLDTIREAETETESLFREAR